MAIELANHVSKICLEKFESLPKTGKPDIAYEWTILSGIVMQRSVAGGDETRLVALATGTKCLGSTQLSEKGDLVNDSHAEVLTRRGFLRYLMQEMKNCLDEKDSVFEFDSLINKFRLNLDVKFHFFTTHSPCGDASIFDNPNRDANDTEIPSKKLKLSSEQTTSEIQPSNVGMTGGKLVNTPESGDLMAQNIGMVRTKPGKGIRTLSLSCSDKMARWNFLGLQGSMLMSILEAPIYWDSIILCDGTDCCERAIERALWTRWDQSVLQSVIKKPFRFNRPMIQQASNQMFFQFRKNRSRPPTGKKFQPAPGGIIWCSGVDR
ncbi:tRNA-specific adenosine deaminase 1 [Uranotaenia lowii]|uniref:tRNA-specific adenosine deaminase 1 n=1 Tax=Uranotaenia lowii TaxID=190385 RepID=UPI002478B942|nr:tRNA-specific adenosine deaminase 1 [Uranotaenia lowii]